jgi:hypothetical protein
MREGSLFMPYWVWKWVRRVLFSINFILISTFLIVVLIALDFYDYRASMRVSSSLGYLFGNFLIIWAFFKLVSFPFRQEKAPTCKHCKKATFGEKEYHLTKPNTNFLVSKVFKLNWVDIYSKKETICMNKKCEALGSFYYSKPRPTHVLISQNRLSRLIIRKKINISSFSDTKS